jgi:hypothetical protein
MNNLPDAIHIGFSKCGSTFLQSYLRQHSKIFLTHKLHFFSPFDFDNFKKGIEYYSQHFKFAGIGSVKVDSDEHIILPIYHPVLGSAATTIDSVKTVVQRIKATVEDVKIILIIRNQVSLILSRYSEYLLAGGKYSFKTFLEENLCCSLDQKNYYQNFYSEVIKILNENFSQSNVLVLLQEEFWTERKKVIERLCEFLNINVEYPTNTKIRDRRIGLSYRGMIFMRALNRLLVISPENFLRPAKTKLPYGIYKFLQRLIRLIDYFLPESLKGSRDQIFPRELKLKVQNIFKEDNIKLSISLNKDLKSLGYLT